MYTQFLNINTRRSEIYSIKLEINLVHLPVSFQRRHHIQIGFIYETYLSNGEKITLYFESTLFTRIKIHNMEPLKFYK